MHLSLENCGVRCQRLREICSSQVAQLQGEAREVVHLRGQLADKESEVAGLRAHLEEALREELADSDPARLRAAQKRAAALEADLAAKQVLAPFNLAEGEPCHLPETAKAFPGTSNRAGSFAKTTCN